MESFKPTYIFNMEDKIIDFKRCSGDELQSGRVTPPRIRNGYWLAHWGGSGERQGESSMAKTSDCQLNRDLNREFGEESGGASDCGRVDDQDAKRGERRRWPVIEKKKLWEYYCLSGGRSERVILTR